MISQRGTWTGHQVHDCVLPLSALTSDGELGSIFHRDHLHIKTNVISIPWTVTP